MTSSLYIVYPIPRGSCLFLERTPQYKSFGDLIFFFVKHAFYVGSDKTFGSPFANFIDVEPSSSPHIVIHPPSKESFKLNKTFKRTKSKGKVTSVLSVRCELSISMMFDFRNFIQSDIFNFVLFFLFIRSKCRLFFMLGRA